MPLENRDGSCIHEWADARSWLPSASTAWSTEAWWTGKPRSSIEEKGLYLVPTFCPYEEAVHYDPEEIKKKQPEFRRKLELYKDALQAGREVICSSKIKLGYGTDFVANHQNYESGYEYEAWLNSGMDPFACIKGRDIRQCGYYYSYPIKSEP